MSLLKKRNIKEIPIQTKYGDERSQLHFKYSLKNLNTLLFFCVRVGVINSKSLNNIFYLRIYINNFLNKKLPSCEGS